MQLQQHLSNLRDFILKYNTYFKTGYDNVIQRANGYVATDNTAVFPADDIGNYFYFRLPNFLAADYANNFIIADNALSIGVRYDVILVACVRNGDSQRMLANMIATLGNYCDEPLRITKMLYRPEDVVFQELSKLKEEEQKLAVKRIPEDFGFCSVHFTFTIPFVFQSLNCLSEPCKQCT